MRCSRLRQKSFRTALFARESNGKGGSYLTLLALSIPSSWCVQYRAWVEPTTSSVGTGIGNAGISVFGNLNQCNTFNDCTVSDNGNVFVLINDFDALRSGKASRYTINRATYAGTNTVEAVIEIQTVPICPNLDRILSLRRERHVGEFLCATRQGLLSLWNSRNQFHWPVVGWALPLPCTRQRSSNIINTRAAIVRAHVGV